MSHLLEKILEHVPMEESELEALISTAPRRYRAYKIPKRGNRGFRTIAQPSAEVKRIQRAVVRYVINAWPVHAAAIAYRKDLSIRNHAKAHVASKYLLKLDFSNFFPSIGLRTIEKHAQRYSKWTPDDLRRLGKILTWEPKGRPERMLSIGAPSSPFVSNSIMYEFDAEVDLFCRDLNITYTRYADDLAFSSCEKEVLSTVLKKVRAVINSEPYKFLKLNDEKTVNVSSGRRRILTGLTITPDKKISIGRDRKRSLRARLYLFSKDLLPSEEIPRLKGELAFVWSVERDFIKSLQSKFGRAFFAKLDLRFSD